MHWKLSKDTKVSYFYDASSKDLNSLFIDGEDGTDKLCFSIDEAYAILSHIYRSRFYGICSISKNCLRYYVNIRGIAISSHLVGSWEYLRQLQLVDRWIQVEEISNHVLIYKSVPDSLLSGYKWRHDEAELQQVIHDIYS